VYHCLNEKCDWLGNVPDFRLTHENEAGDHVPVCPYCETGTEVLTEREALALKVTQAKEEFNDHDLSWKAVLAVIEIEIEEAERRGFERGIREARQELDRREKVIEAGINLDNRRQS
jgi:hypothetical protein